MLCANCRAWDHSTSGSGKCRIGPPKIFVPHRERFIWPETKAEDWCFSFIETAGPKLNPGTPAWKETFRNTHLFEGEKEE